MHPLVSVIIPLYNAEHYIVETIESVKNQTWPNKEIIVVNDGSTDRSYDVARQMENDWIKVVTQPNSGASRARNHGLSLAKGDFVQFLDADDLISSSKLEVQVNALLQEPGKIAACSTVYFFDGENHLGNPAAQGEADFVFSTSDSFEFLLNLYGVNGRKAMVTVHSWLTPMSVINKAGLWNETITVDDDGEFFCRVILESKGIVSTPGVFNYYRKFKKGVNLSAKSDKDSVASMVKAIDLKYAHLLNKRQAERERIELTMARHYLSAAAGLYPKHRRIVDYCLQQAKKLGFTKINYEGGKAGKIFSNLFGWKFTKDLSYFMHYIKAKIFNS